ncbi:MAG: 30S ribosomal protein S9 [Leptospiraceae bacterium]|nr:30S ribosomal protein S9 [Leptospiraceae bacterium]MDW7976394.1 30S ribosomal protein S9 [Leptospiraceae bacterium]
MENQTTTQTTEKKKQRVIFVGRRKTSVARVRLKEGNGKVIVNKRTLEEYLPILRLQKHAIEPLEITNLRNQFDVYVNVKGGGIDGQAGAIRLGIARAIEAKYPELRKVLKQHKMLTRDPRMVERKKYGKHKARRSTQFSKR